MTDVLALVKKYVDPIRRRVALMIGRCVIQAVSDTTDNALQTSQVTILAGEVQDDVETVRQYGFTSNPLPGAEGVMVFPAGDRSHGLIIAIDDRRYRLKGLASGEVALYTDEGDYIWFKRGRKIHFRSNSFIFQGATDELLNLVAQLSQQVENIADTLSTTTTNTAFGAMKLNDFATFATIKSTVDAIRSKVVGVTG